MPKKRNNPTVTGLNLEQWKNNSSRLVWAQQDPLFKEIVSVVQNASHLALVVVPGATENRMFGRAEGFQMALDVLNEMAKKPDKPKPSIEPTYEKPEDIE